MNSVKNLDTKQIAQQYMKSLQSNPHQHTKNLNSETELRTDFTSWLSGYTSCLTFLGEAVPQSISNHDEIFTEIRRAQKAAA
jgi:hypothetical protein